MFQMVQDLGLKIIRLLSEDLITFTVFDCLKKSLWAEWSLTQRPEYWSFVQYAGHSS